MKEQEISQRILTILHAIFNGETSKSNITGTSGQLEFEYTMPHSQLAKATVRFLTAEEYDHLFASLPPTTDPATILARACDRDLLTGAWSHQATQETRSRSLERFNQLVELLKKMPSSSLTVYRDDQPQTPARTNERPLTPIGYEPNTPMPKPDGSHLWGDFSL